jgi:RNA polymerase sigma factor (sigma-70 family)
LTSTQRTVEAIWRIESAKVIATLTRLVRDVGVAEDLAQDAFVAALEQWPQSGVPDNPGAWLTTAARHRAIDLIRRREVLARKEVLLAGEARIAQAAAAEESPAEFEARIGDDLLSLIFLTCHPLLATAARVALTLRLFGGLGTDEIARALLQREPTITQRIVRAKRTLAAANVPFEIPDGEGLVERLGSVLEVIYLIFNEGYAATAGGDWMRLELCEEALRLGRVLAELMPDQSEVHGLVALMEIQSSRATARTGPGGEPVLLADQDRTRWDRRLIGRGLTALARAEALGKPFGPYALQAAIAACHARAGSTQSTDWIRIVALYDALVQVTGSPVVELNRAVAVGMAFGPDAALELVDGLRDGLALRDYHLLPSVRGDLLERLGRDREAAVEFRRAAELTRNERERELLVARAGECDTRCA